MLSTGLIALGLFLTLATNAMPQGVLAEINRAAMDQAQDYIRRALQEPRYVFFVTGLYCLLIVGIFYYFFGPFTWVESDLQGALVINSLAPGNPWVPPVIMTGCLGALVFLGVFVFALLARLHPGGAIGVVGLVTDLPDILADIARLMA